MFGFLIYIYLGLIDGSTYAVFHPSNLQPVIFFSRGICNNVEVGVGSS